MRERFIKDPYSSQRIKDKSRFAPKPKKEKPKLPENLDVLYGFHSVEEALLNPNRVFSRLIATENAIAKLTEKLTLPIEPEIVKADIISELLPKDAVHQGLYLEVQRLDALRLSDLNEDGIILALDQITDPHNVGAILRTAAAFSVKGIITTMRHSPEISGVLAKAASGGLEHVPFVEVTNLVRALTELKDEKFFQIIGLDSEGEKEFSDIKVRLPVVLVLGAEGKGIRASTRALCDHIVKIELPGVISSLNVSNAAAISLYALNRSLA